MSDLLEITSRPALSSFVGEVMTDHPNEFKAQLEQSNKAGLPIAQHDSQELSKALEARAEAEAKVKADDTESHSEVEKELVPATNERRKSKGRRKHSPNRNQSIRHCRYYVFG
jgi:hypothetical protein